MLRETTSRGLCGLGWSMHYGVEVTESSTNKQHHLSSLRITHLRTRRNFAIVLILQNMQRSEKVNWRKGKRESTLVIMALCRSVSRRSIREHKHIDKFGCANGYTHAFQACYSDDIKLGFCKILFIEFTETLEQVVMIDVLEHKFASSLSGDTGDGDVDFDFGHVETLFRVLSKPLAHLNQHLEGCLEWGIDVQIVGETNPASIAMVGETRDL